MTTAATCVAIAMSRAVMYAGKLFLAAMAFLFGEIARGLTTILEIKHPRR